MKFNQHLVLEGSHAFLSPSNYHWINDSDDKLRNRYSNYKAAQRGVELHEFASSAIKKKIKVARLKNALYQFINDCIGFNMESEVLLYYSPYCYGTTDAISFRNNFLRIFDYKSGVTKASFKQLEIYAAIFCLEYSVNPEDIEIELRIYQGQGYVPSKPEPGLIRTIMDRIVESDMVLKQIEQLDT